VSRLKNAISDARGMIKSLSDEAEDCRRETGRPISGISSVGTGNAVSERPKSPFSRDRFRIPSSMSAPDAKAHMGDTEAFKRFKVGLGGTTSIFGKEVALGVGDGDSLDSIA
jgi:hypothetical protein